jgi:hypothetical protein
MRFRPPTHDGYAVAKHGRHRIYSAYKSLSYCHARYELLCLRVSLQLLLADLHHVDDRHYYISCSVSKYIQYYICLNWDAPIEYVR